MDDDSGQRQRVIQPGSVRGKRRICPKNRCSEAFLSQPVLGALLRKLCGVISPGALSGIAMMAARASRPGTAKRVPKNTDRRRLNYPVVRHCSGRKWCLKTSVVQADKKAACLGAFAHFQATDTAQRPSSNSIFPFLDGSWAAMCSLQIAVEGGSKTGMDYDFCNGRAASG